MSGKRLSATLSFVFAIVLALLSIAGGALQAQTAPPVQCVPPNVLVTSPTPHCVSALSHLPPSAVTTAVEPLHVTPTVVVTAPTPGIVHSDPALRLMVSMDLWPAWPGPFVENKPIIFHWRLKNMTPIVLDGKFAVMLDGASVNVPALPLVPALSPSAEQTGDFSLPGLPAGQHSLVLQFLAYRGKTARLPDGVKVQLYDQIGQAPLDVPVVVAPVDADKDGLDDHFEHALLEHYRPYYKFSKPGLVERLQREPDFEPLPPIDVADYLRHSSVGWSHADWQLLDKLLDPSIFQNGQFDALLGLDITSDDTCTDNMKNCGSDMTINRRKTRYAIDASSLPDAHQADMDLEQATGNIGLYGHVVPYDQSTGQGAIRKYFASDASGSFIKIEYWQLFRANGGPAPHGGDWTTVQLLIEINGTQPCQGPTQFGQIVSVLHYHHGDESRFDFSHCTKQASTGETGVDDFTSSTGDHVLMYQDAAGDYSHPVVYIEYATHEFWPTSGGSKAGEPGHPGDGPSFLTATPPNLGEVENPLAEYPQAKILMRYNGFWGACCLANNPPPGPALHTEWTWPADSSVRWMLTGMEK